MAALDVSGIAEDLRELGYKGLLLNDEDLHQAIIDGLASQPFIQLVMSLVKELTEGLSLTEAITTPSGMDDMESFSMEMRALLKEMDCHHQSLVQDLTALSLPDNRLTLLDYLICQVMSTRLIKKKINDLEKKKFEDDITSISSNLSAILTIYGISAPPSHVTPSMIFDKIISKTKEVMSKAPPNHVGPSLVIQPLTNDQWGTIGRINDTLTNEYSLRRKMLLTRCNVTIQSFKWSDRTKDKNDEFSRIFQERWNQMKERVDIPIARILAAKKGGKRRERENEEERGK
jgi:hypothetical protein